MLASAWWCQTSSLRKRRIQECGGDTWWLEEELERCLAPARPRWTDSKSSCRWDGSKAALSGDVCVSTCWPAVLVRFTPPRATACRSPEAFPRWSEREVWGHCGEETASTSSKSLQRLQLSSWPTNRLASLWQKAMGDFFFFFLCQGSVGWQTVSARQIKRLIGSNQETLGIAERLVAGSLAGAIAQSSIYPMEVSHEDLNIVICNTKSQGRHSVVCVCVCQYSRKVQFTWLG